MKKISALILMIMLCAICMSANAASISYHSSNQSTTAKKGNTGVYAYETYGGMYTNYCIVDFNAKLVYFFSEGNMSSTCYQIPMVRGDLNSVLVITYYDGNDKWSEGLHFKWKNQPDHLIVQDNDGFEYDYYGASLTTALRIRDKKEIYDFSSSGRGAKVRNNSSNGLLNQTGNYHSDNNGSDKKGKTSLMADLKKNHYARGDRGADVLTIKNRLQELGYFSKGATLSDQYNNTMVERVKQFQKNNQLTISGEADAETLNVLFSDEAIGQ